MESSRSLRGEGATKMRRYRALRSVEKGIREYATKGSQQVR